MLEVTISFEVLSYEPLWRKNNLDFGGAKVQYFIITFHRLQGTLPPRTSGTPQK